MIRIQMQRAAAVWIILSHILANAYHLHDFCVQLEIVLHQSYLLLSSYLWVESGDSSDNYLSFYKRLIFYKSICDRQRRGFFIKTGHITFQLNFIFILKKPKSKNKATQQLIIIIMIIIMIILLLYESTWRSAQEHSYPVIEAIIA